MRTYLLQALEIPLVKVISFFKELRKLIKHLLGIFTKLRHIFTKLLRSIQVLIVGGLRGVKTCWEGEGVILGCTTDPSPYNQNWNSSNTQNATKVIQVMNGYFLFYIIYQLSLNNWLPQDSNLSKK